MTRNHYCSFCGAQGGGRGHPLGGYAARVLVQDLRPPRRTSPEWVVLCEVPDNIVAVGYV